MRMGEQKGKREKGKEREGGKEGSKLNNISYFVATSAVKRGSRLELVGHLNSRQQGEKGQAQVKSLKYQFIIIWQCSGGS